MGEIASHRRPPLRGILVPLALAAILLIGAYFRFTGINWDSNTHLHPDERFITMVETSISLPGSVGEYFDTQRSPLNPYNRGYGSFVYGTFPLFLVRAIGEALGQTGYDEIHLVGRAVSGLFDLGSVLLLFFIGRRLFGTRTALLASLLTAGAVIQIQQSHFFTFDTFVGFFLLASFFFALRLWQEKRWYDYPLLGAALGLAVASKINAASFLVVVAVVGLKQLWDESAPGPDRRERWIHIVGSFAMTGLAMLVVFRVVQPYAFAGPSPWSFGLSPKFLDDMGYVQKLVSGEIDQPPSVQWANTTPYLFPLQNLVLWGMGLPLGLVGWAGLAFAAFRLLVKRDARYLLIAGWVAFYFWFQGGQFAKTMRYFLPIVPLLALLGAHLIAELGRALRGGSGPSSGGLRKYVAPALAVAVVAGTLLYAFAFTRIHTKPVTRIAATEWIFANIPQGTAIANEHWDDPLPIRWQGRDAGWYSGEMLEMYAEDNPEKLSKLAAQLDRTEYIFLSSNRLYESIPRIPARYPMSSEYYRLLFSGELGFDLIKTFTSYPTLFGIEINDDAAEEIFSVYDHPKVLIFKKSAGYSPEKVRLSLAAALEDRALPLKSVQAQHNGLLLSETDLRVQREGGTWSDIFNRDSLANRLPAVTWWLALQLMGLLALPITWLVFARLPDRGYGLSKLLGLLVVAYLAWLLPSLHLLPFGRLAVVTGMAALSAVSLATLWRRGPELVRFVRANRELVLVHELVFLGAFLLFLWIRAWNPDLWHTAFGGERPMEFAYLNAVAKSTYFPPYDPWLSGGYINYYYFGYVIVASLMRLTGIVPAVTFNLAIATVFALSFSGLYTFGSGFWPRLRGAGARALHGRAALVGLATAVAVLIAGNLDGAIQILEGLWKMGGAQIESTIPFVEGTLKAAAGVVALMSGVDPPTFDFWRSTRIVGPLESPTPIMEFPFFTFLYGDLHPHMMSMPIAALALSLALAIARQGVARQSPRPSPVGGGSGAEAVATEERGATRGVGSAAVALEAHAEDAARSSWSAGERLLSVAAAGFVAGLLQVTNSWDYPTYLVLLCAAFATASLVRDRRPTVRGVVDALLAALGALIVAQLLFLPFTSSYELFYNGVELSGAKTLLQHYLVMFGLFIFCCSSVLLAAISRNRWLRFWGRHYLERLGGTPGAARRATLIARLVRPSVWTELLPYAVSLLVAAAALAGVARLALVSMLIVLAILAILSLYQREPRPENMLPGLLVGLGVALTLAVEFVVIKGDIGRMNTVFKFYLQAWFLFGVASAVGVAGLIWPASSGRRPPRSGWRRAWTAALAGLAIAVLVYPVMATPTRVSMRLAWTPPTLDGMAYMARAKIRDQDRQIDLSRDHAALTWLQDNVIGSPVVLEAQIPEYRWGSRVSIYTGLPTVLGWNWHQRQQRAGYHWMVEERARDVKTLYESTDYYQVMDLLDKYDVRLIYVGDLERAYYPPAGLDKFEDMVGRGLTVVYRSDGVTIYEVTGSGPPGAVKG